MNQKNNHKEGDSLNDFVKFINAQNKISRIKNGTGRGKPINNDVKLIEVILIILVAGLKFNSIFSLIGNNLKVFGKEKKLNQDEMDELFDFVENTLKLGEFGYYPSYTDLTIIDGNSYLYNINWNGIVYHEKGGNTMPVGFSKLFEYCNKIVK